MLRNACVGRTYWKCEIGLIPEHCSYKAKLTRLVKSLHLDERSGKGVVFLGDHGMGKTSAASILLKSAMARGGQCYSKFASAAEYAYNNRWADTNLDGIPAWDLLVGSQFLLLDDLGTELASGGYKVGDIRAIEELVRRRYDNKLVTYVTTNLKLPAFKEAYRSISRILLDEKISEVVSVSGHFWGG